MDGDVRVTRLENGLRVVSERVRDSPALSLAVWVAAGSRDETLATNGVAHFLEHLVFKGTATRTARAIAEEIEGLGGSINAFTDKEVTCFHTRTLGSDLAVAFDVLRDMLRNPSLRQEDVELERTVILQEIFEIEDTPEDFVHDFHLASYWPGHPLGWPVTGTAESVARLSRRNAERYLTRCYTADRLVVAAAGPVDHEELVAMSRDGFGDLASSTSPLSGDRPDFRPGVFLCERDLEQVHLVLGLPGLAVSDRRIETAEAIVAALGGGMSSRLFQSVREERGKAYSIEAFQSPFRDIGYSGVYAATTREFVSEVLELIFVELRDLAAHGLGSTELERVRRLLLAGIPLGLETTEARMSRLARNLLDHGRTIPVAEIVADIEAITNDDIIEVAREMFTFERAAVAVVGAVESSAVSIPAV